MAMRIYIIATPERLPRLVSILWRVSTVESTDQVGKYHETYLLTSDNPTAERGRGCLNSENSTEFQNWVTMHLGIKFWENAVARLCHNLMVFWWATAPSFVAGCLYNSGHDIQSWFTWSSAAVGSTPHHIFWGAHCEEAKRSGLVANQINVVLMEGKSATKQF